MLGPKEELEYNILRVASAAGDLIGSGTLCHGLDQYGMRISEATAGRLLRNLDKKGYTERVSFKGRRLTDLGRNRLQELAGERERASFGSELLKVLKARGKQELIDILIARRAIERETARLAAQNANAAEVAELGDIIRRHREVVKSGGSGSDEDVRFHQLISSASRNKVLMAAADLIRQDGQLAPMLTVIRKSVHSTVVDDHIRIYEAIRAGDPAAAESAMVTHIENLIRDVRKYWSKYGGDEQSPPAQARPPQDSGV
ncbi:MAG: FCD domain-containing protein [Firmicutes bacterium]|nr:FCD domain-containing protein [Bacillota bacterium]